MSDRDVSFFEHLGIIRRPGGAYLWCCATFAPCVVVGNIAEAHYEKNEGTRTDVCFVTSCVGSGTLWLFPLFGFVLNVPPALLTPVMVVPCLGAGLLNHAVKTRANLESTWWKSMLLGVLYPCTICQARTTQHVHSLDLVNFESDDGSNTLGRKARFVAPRQMTM